MTRPVCLSCDRRPASVGLLCERDRDSLAADLTALRRHYARLDPVPGTGSARGGRPAPGFGSRSPARDSVLVLTDPRPQTFDPDRPTEPAGIVRVLGWWADAARDAGLVPQRTAARTVAGETAALAAHLDRIAGQWWIADLLEAVRAAVGHLRTVQGELEPTIPLGACPHCGQAVRARSWGQRARCSGCSAQWAGLAQLRELGEALGDALMDAAGIARYCEAPVTTIRVWAHRDGWARTRRGGRTLYRLDDARASVLARTTRTAAS